MKLRAKATTPASGWNSSRRMSLAPCGSTRWMPACRRWRATRPTNGWALAPRAMTRMEARSDAPGLPASARYRRAFAHWPPAQRTSSGAHVRHVSSASAIPPHA